MQLFLFTLYSGRSYPEADNPGEVLSVIGEHWLFSLDLEWLQAIYPNVTKLVEMIRYYRMTPGTHWVAMTGIQFGPDLPPKIRRILEDGRCDGYHPEYTYAFDIAGIRKAIIMANATGREIDVASWTKLANILFQEYDQRFGQDLSRGYGSYSGTVITVPSVYCL